LATGDVAAESRSLTMSLYRTACWSNCSSSMATQADVRRIAMTPPEVEALKTTSGSPSEQRSPGDSCGREGAHQPKGRARESRCHRGRVATSHSDRSSPPSRRSFHRAALQWLPPVRSAAP
jgi:hypothetical protein